MKNSRVLNIAYFVCGAGLFIYVMLRALFVPPYADEIGTFFWYVQNGSFQPFYSVLEANNHVINSLFSHLFFLLMGDSLFVLRLGNILCFALYVFYLWKIQELFSNRFIGFCCSLTLLFTFYLLEFFSLARGYGMSMAFFVASLYYQLKYSSEHKSKFLWGGLFMTSLALWANLSLMIPVIIMGSFFIILFFKDLFRKRTTENIIVNAIVIVVLFIIPLYYAIEFSLLLKESGHLYHGSPDSFINGTVLNLVTEFSESYTYGKEIFYFLFAAYLIVGLYALFSGAVKVNSVFIHVLFWVTVFGTITLHVTAGVNYPQNRAAIYFYVLFMFALFFALDHFKFKIKFFLSAVTALIFLIQFITTINLNYAPVWKDETIPVSFYNYLLRWQNERGIMPIVSAHGLLGKVVDYYNYQDGSKMRHVEENDFPGKTADFIITNNWNTIDISAQYDTVLQNKKTNTALMQRKELVRWSPVRILNGDSRSSSDDFFPVFEIPADRFRGSPFCYNVSVKVQSNKFPFIGKMVTELRNSTGDVIAYRSIDLQRIKPDIRQNTNIICRQYLEMIPMDAAIIKAYIWNLKKRNLNTSEIKITLMKGAIPEQGQ